MEGCVQGERNGVRIDILQSDMSKHIDKLDTAVESLHRTEANVSHMVNDFRQHIVESREYRPQIEQNTLYRKISVWMLALLTVSSVSQIARLVADIARKVYAG